MRRPAQHLLSILALCAAAFAAPAVEYTVTLANPSEHLVHVRMRLPATSAERAVQLPVWNGLYQVRDFVQSVLRVRAHDVKGRELPVEKLDKSTWRIRSADAGVDIDYDAYINLPGPFGIQFNDEHAFFNLALLLMYAKDARDSPVQVEFVQVPAKWRVTTSLQRIAAENSQRSNLFSAPNYDRMVDSPVEYSAFRDLTFEQNGAVYRIVAHASAADYNLEKMAAEIRKIVAASVEWMNDRPFSEYLFIYHFPHLPGGGGMEHAYGTAIDLSAERILDDPLYFAQVTAHEFFHLWNVKRIRPASLEPIDYTRENYTRALWFSEGATSSAASLILVRAGLMDERAFLAELEREIRTLQLRPAHSQQSAEESSLDTWLDKYPPYRLPERSISYYNKGEVLGLLLDLAMRRASHGTKSLRDLFRWMNQNYAHKGRYFQDSDGVREAAEALTGKDFSAFFKRYVAGVEELPYDELLATVGLQLKHAARRAPTTGFESVRNFDSPPVIVTVEEGSEAAKVGLVPGDAILEINGKQAATEVDEMIAGKQPGDIVKLRVQGVKGRREVKLKLGGRQEEDFKLIEMENVTPAQRARRAAWLSSESEPAAAGAASAK